MYGKMNNGHSATKRFHLSAFARVLATCLVSASLFFTSAAMAGLPAFPGAQGGGALAVGGRGGAVCKVTNLNDTGPGSLRACVDMKGPRMVIFEVGGAIELESRLQITNPYITIAGQTASGDGIQLKAASGLRGDMLMVRTHDVVIRHLRLRRGVTGHKLGVLNIIDQWHGVGDIVKNVIVDHVSLYWTENENLAIWGLDELTAPRNITVQNSIMAEALNRPNVAVGGQFKEAGLQMNDVDLHGNLFANSTHRNPTFRPASGRFINNIVYNASYWWTRMGSGTYADVIGNKYKRGPSRLSSTRAQEELHFWQYSEEMGSPERHLERDSSLYIVGNRGEASGMSPEIDNWRYTRLVGEAGGNAAPVGPTPEEYKRSPWEPLPHAGVPITVRNADDLEGYVLPHVGASKRLDCGGNWVPNRDSVDSRLIEEYFKEQGITSPSHPDEVGGFPVLSGGVPCVDSSGDGIPDEWLLANSLDTADASLGATIHTSGYSYLELYLNGMRVESAVPAPQAPGAISVN